MTPEQKTWCEGWLSGLRDGSLTTAAGFIRKLSQFGLSDEQMAILTDLYVQLGVQKLCDVVEAVLIDGVAFNDAVEGAKNGQG